MYSGRKILQKWGKFDLVREGQIFLDYGCGSGSFTIPAARIVGTKGKVYALDCFRRQLDVVKKKSTQTGLTNVETILSNGKIALTDESIDVIWMCDVIHEIEERRALIEELHRVLKKDGVLAIYDGMREKVLNYTDGLFFLMVRDDKLLRFRK
jgi:ubiquinone/menaquinone biosynthesis C-methylase UbiE